jgi:hypothetical protein
MGSPIIGVALLQLCCHPTPVIPRVVRGWDVARHLQGWVAARFAQHTSQLVTMLRDLGGAAAIKLQTSEVRAHKLSQQVYFTSAAAPLA